jgi:hypothetical protein
MCTASRRGCARDRSPDSAARAYEKELARPDGICLGQEFFLDAPEPYRRRERDSGRAGDIGGTLERSVDGLSSPDALPHRSPTRIGEFFFDDPDEPQIRSVLEAKVHGCVNGLCTLRVIDCTHDGRHQCSFQSPLKHVRLHRPQNKWGDDRRFARSSPHPA